MFEEKLCQGRRALVILLLFCAPLFINLGANSLWDGNEAFYAEPPRELLESRSLLIPTYNYEPRFKKPPFATWVIAAFYATFGVTEAAERLPVALAATATILLVFAVGRRLLDARAALAAALILATMLKFMVYARQFAGDLFLTFFISATILCFARAMLAEDTRTRTIYKLLAYAAIGFGMLDKGLVAIVLPYAVLGLWIVLMRRWQLLRLLLSPGGFLLILLIGTPWYLLMIYKYGWAFFQVNIIQETVKRYTTDELGGRAVHYYVGVYLAETFPWSLFTVPAFVYWLRWLRREARRLPQLELGAGMPLLALVWFGFTFIFYSISIGKRAVYLLALYPAAALIIGHYFSAALFARDRLVARLQRMSAALLVFISLTGAAIILLAYGKLEIRTALIYLPVVSLLALGFSLGWLLKRGNLDGQYRAVALGALALIFSLTLIMPKIEYYRPVPRFARVVKGQASARAAVGTFFVDTPSLMFYAERKIFQCWDFDEMVKRLESEPQVYFVTRQDYLEMLAGRTTIALDVIDSQPLLQLRWENFFGRAARPTLKLVLVRKRSG